MHSRDLPVWWPMRWTTLARCLGAALAIGACAGGARDQRGIDSVALSPSARPAADVATAADTGCRKVGDWSMCAIEDRLERAGVVAERQSDSVAYPFLTVRGVEYLVGSKDHRLQVFLYPNAAQRARDTDALDSVAVSPKGTKVAWPTPPTLVTSNNLAVIIISLNDRTVERLALALGAGLPAAPKP